MDCGNANKIINVLGEDYVVFAEAKGVSHRRLLFSYAARNALLPQITSVAIALSTIIGGQILIEQVFSYPGIGYELQPMPSQAKTTHWYKVCSSSLLCRHY